MSDEGKTTAQLLGDFYADLVKAGVPVEIAGEIIRDAAHGLIRDEASL